MKNTYKIFALLTFLMLTISCENDGGDSKIDTQYGALVNVQKTATTDAFINILALENNEDISLGFTIDVALGDIASLDIIGLYTKLDGTILKGNFATGIKELPYTVNFDQNDIINTFDGLNATSDIQIGEKLTISAILTLKDGRVLKLLNDDGSINFTSKINNTNIYKNFQVYNVSCGSFLGGIYEYSTTNVGESGGYFTSDTFTGTVTFEDLGGGIYLISDATFGGYDVLYGDIAKNVELQDICNQISFKGTNQYGDSFSMTNLIVNGNKISFHWETSYGEYGDTTLTRTDNTDWPDLTL